MSLFHREPGVGELGRYGEVRRHHHHLGAAVARLGQVVGVRGAGHRDVGAAKDDVGCVVPVRRLVHVGLLAPDLRGGRGKVAVPVVEAHGDAAEELQEARSRRIADHRHGGNGGKSDDAVRAVLLRGVDVGGGDDLGHGIPVAAPETTHAALAGVGGAFLLVLYDASPGVHRVGVKLSRLGPAVEQRAAQVGVLDPQGAVEVPGEGDAARAAAGLVVRDGAVELRVVVRLQFPADDAVLHVHHPATAAGTVDAVGAAHHLVVLVAVAVELLPLPVLRRTFVLDPVV